MKLYKSEIFKESKEKIKEASFMVNTVQDAQDTITKCVQIILKKKNLNVGACMYLIGDGIINGLGTVEELFPKVSNIEQLNIKSRVIGSRLSRYIMSFSKTK